MPPKLTIQGQNPEGLRAAQRFRQDPQPAPTVSNYLQPITEEMELNWEGNGWYPEEVEMIKRLHDSGLPVNLSAIAARQIMGLNHPDPLPEAEWEQFVQKHPYRAATKKLVRKGGEIASGIGEFVTRPAVPSIEKLSAAKMLKDYLMAQDAQRAGQAQSQALWSATHYPEQTLAGSGSNPLPPTGPTPLPYPGQRK